MLFLVEYEHKETNYYNGSICWVTQFEKEEDFSKALASYKFVKDQITLYTNEGIESYYRNPKIYSIASFPNDLLEEVINDLKSK